MAPTYAIAEKGADIILSKPASSALPDSILMGATNKAYTLSPMLVGVVAIVVSLFCSW